MAESIENLLPYYLNDYPVHGDNFTADQVAEDAKILAEEIERLRKANWYWDDERPDAIAESIQTAVSSDYDGEIVELRPLHELSRVFVLVTEDGYELFDTREAAEAKEK